MVPNCVKRIVKSLHPYQVSFLEVLTTVKSPQTKKAYRKSKKKFRIFCFSLPIILLEWFTTFTGHLFGTTKCNFLCLFLISLSNIYSPSRMFLQNLYFGSNYQFFCDWKVFSCLVSLSKFSSLVFWGFHGGKEVSYIDFLNIRSKVWFKM